MKNGSIGIGVWIELVDAGVVDQTGEWGLGGGFEVSGCWIEVRWVWSNKCRYVSRVFVVLSVG